MKIIIDAMGGDNSPDEIIKGCVDTVNEIESEIILVGNEKIINEKVKEFYGKENISEVNNKLSIRNATEVIENTESPTDAIKKKKDSSMVVAFNMLKNGEGDAFVSAGSTALCPILPTYDGKGFMLVDAGANTNCRPVNLLQFAEMGQIYMKNVMGVENPKVGLLNIGAEEGKGNELMKESFVKLSENENVNFYGNIEGRDIFNGDVSVVVADGFTGNVTLKTTEGIGAMVTKLLKEELMSNLFYKILAMLMKPALKRFKKRMDYSEYGGALLLGIKKPMIKCHGTANAKIVKFTLKQAENFAKNNVVESIEKIIMEEKNKEEK